MRQLDFFKATQLSDPLDPQPEPIDGLEYIPGFLTVHEQATLVGEIDARPWLDELARRVQHYGYRYDYRARRVSRDMLIGELPRFLWKLGERVAASGKFPGLPDQAIINEYLPGQGISKHVDCVSCFGSTLASVSTGSHCEMEFQHGDQTQRQLLEAGSLLVLAREARYTWTHAIRPRHWDQDRPRQRRVSITFRTVQLA